MFDVSCPIVILMVMGFKVGVVSWVDFLQPNKIVLIKANSNIFFIIISFLRYTYQFRYLMLLPKYLRYIIYLKILLENV